MAGPAGPPTTALFDGDTVCSCTVQCLHLCMIAYCCCSFISGQWLFIIVTFLTVVVVCCDTLNVRIIYCVFRRVVPLCCIIYYAAYSRCLSQSDHTLLSNKYAVCRVLVWYCDSCAFISRLCSVCVVYIAMLEAVGNVLAACVQFLSRPTMWVIFGVWKYISWNSSYSLLCKQSDLTDRWVESICQVIKCGNADGAVFWNTPCHSRLSYL